MGEHDQFKHIRIGAQPSDARGVEEPDEVIVIGSDERISKNGEPETASIGEDGIESPLTGEDAPAVATADGDPRALRKQDGYTPTTLEDIESSKMPRTQIAVIVIAVICLAAFVAWYLLFC